MVSEFSLDLFRVLLNVPLEYLFLIKAGNTVAINKLSLFGSHKIGKRMQIGVACWQQHEEGRVGTLMMVSCFGRKYV